MFGDPVTHTFGVWGLLGEDHNAKLWLYVGWTNGYLAALTKGDDVQRKRVDEFYDCLASMKHEDALALIDKYYKDHPDLWSRPLPDMLVTALTVSGTPCDGKAPDQ